MKITFVLPVVGMSGGIRVISIYAKWLHENGHAVTLVSPAPPRYGIRQSVKSLLSGKGWPQYKRELPSHFDGLGLDHRIVVTVNEDTVPEADVVIATWWETAEWVHALPPLKGKKFYFVQGHEIFDFCPIERVRGSYRLPMLKIVVAEWLRRLMREEYTQSNVVQVSNAVDHKQFFAAERGRQVAPTLGLLYSSTSFKGLGVALQAIEKLKSVLPDLAVICFGSEHPERGELPDYFEFHYSPEQNRIRDLYARCDVWLAASTSEGFNLPAMEAMACRTPVVSTRTGWPEESIRAGWNGFLAEVNDVQGLFAGALSVLQCSDSAWREISRNAWETVKDASWERSAKRFEQVLLGNVCAEDELA